VCRGKLGARGRRPTVYTLHTYFAAPGTLGVMLSSYLLLRYDKYCCLCDHEHLSGTGRLQQKECVLEKGTDVC